MTIHSNLLLFPTMRFTSFFSAVGFLFPVIIAMSGRHSCIYS